MSALHSARCSQCGLTGLCLATGISGDELAQLESIIRQHRVIPRDGQLFLTGDRMRSVYVARRGAFKSIAISENGDAHILAFHLPGELIGLDGMASGLHECDAIALEETEVCEIPYEALNDAAVRIPSLQRQLMRSIGQSLSRDQQHTAVLVRRQASERVALFLHALSHRYRALGQSPTHMKLAMSREDSASYLGLALETVSRAFSKLQDDGVISVHGRRVTILDEAALAEIAHGQ